MGKTLILTGWGYHSYAFAAAMVLKRYPQADILGMSRRHLPEYLEEVNGYDEIIILGISLTGDAERLAKALKLLKQNGIKVVWLSSIDFPESIGDDVRSNLESLVDGDDVTDAVGTKYGLDLHDFMELWDENTSIGQKYGEFIEAAGYFHRNYQDDLAYPRVIRHIAAKDDEKKWTDSERQMIMHYRRYGHHELVGNSHAMTDLKEKINRIAVHDHARVLILGESGTGKETVAEQLH
ncbi:MAG: sigma 54-interacting transcriptional regulator, partial [Victivallales bacterium]|nr:sigma 54-interacting transcriptional regulator [Victivallales bacterium]